jgi:hypothetical protein
VEKRKQSQVDMCISVLQYLDLFTVIKPLKSVMRL